ncbi:MAG: bifunctional 5,10-methylenetetrahydrofolate dehydrogenase/5,10-methenyltetrahydrofolate cyclohydrolase [Candidatus Omnitrophica bacterium]|nr:bifunctional 5,10-methylenetetrahydrofolate dehydrogenase/5,10-methenyltetrahydrofolate cyclohydrolase [Candidatus Omnitrophota bacterium]
MAQLLDGRALAKDIKAGLSAQVARLHKEFAQVPRMVNIMIGNDDGSCAYANSQKKVAQAIGIEYELVNLPLDITQEHLSAEISRFNADPQVNGIMLHKPVPEHIDYNSIANLVQIEKDLEGINVANIGKMLLGETTIIPCTPQAVMEHIKSTGVDIRGKEAVIVGASGIVGKPLSILLVEQYVTVTVCHIATSEAGRLEEHVRRADILVVAVGRARLIPGLWIKEGAIVIDVGINRVESGIVGDVDFDAAKERAAYITPVPGGVGPVTVCMLMKNAVEAFKLQNIKRRDA